MILYTDIDPFCCKVLQARIDDGSLPHGDVLEKDIREITADDLAGYRQIHLFAGIGGFGLAQKWSGFDGELITGGFPCQDISVAGRGEGIEGSRSGLWSEMSRIIGIIRPRFVLVENVSALLSRGLSRVLGDLAEIGYDAEWHCIPASAVGAPHRRDRVWIVAYTDSSRERIQQIRQQKCKSPPQFEDDGTTQSLANSLNMRQLQPQGSQQNERRRAGNGCLPNHDSAGQPHIEGRAKTQERNGVRAVGSTSIGIGEHEGWSLEPDMGRVAHGVPQRVDRLKSLGNAIVPQVAEVIMRAMIETGAPDRQ